MINNTIYSKLNDKERASRTPSSGSATSFKIKANICLYLLIFCIYSCGSSSEETASTIDPMMQQNLKKEWTDLISKFTDNQSLIEQSWSQIEQYYTEKNRAYHNLTHINNMLIEASKFDHKIADKEVVLLAIWFHDIIYDPMSKENEKASAEFAKNILSQTTLSPERIEKCYALIMQTVKHQPAEADHLDDKLLVDFDLEILSRDWEAYKIYSGQVRKEYWMYPSPLFKNGRKKAMGKFLERPTIYQTPFYQGNREAKARENIKREMEELL